MARLKTINPLVSKIAPRLARTPTDETERSRYRDETQGWRKWYKTARWQKLRMTMPVRDLFTCRMCKIQELWNGSIRDVSLARSEPRISMRIELNITAGS